MALGRRRSALRPLLWQRLLATRVYHVPHRQAAGWVWARLSVHQHTGCSRPSRTCEPCPEGRAHRAAWPLRWQRGPSALSCQVSGQGDARHGRVHGLAEPQGPHGAAVISSDRRAEAASGWSGFCFRSVLVWLEAKVVALTVAPQGSVPIRQSLIDAGPRAGRHAGAENRGGPGWGPGGRGDAKGVGKAGGPDRWS